MRANQSSKGEVDDNGLAPRKYYLPSLPLVEYTKDTKVKHPVSVLNLSDSHRLRSQINPVQQLIFEQANKASGEHDPKEALERMVMMKNCSNKRERMAYLRMHLLTLLSYRQITAERCVHLIKVMEQQCEEQEATGSN